MVLFTFYWMRLYLFLAATTAQAEQISSCRRGLETQEECALSGLGLWATLGARLGSQAQVFPLQGDGRVMSPKV